MRLDNAARTRSFMRAALASLLTLIAQQAGAQTITGTATYRERMALPPGAVLEATLEDVSKADAPADTIARQRITSPGNPPIAFTIAYDPARIVENRTYVVRTGSSSTASRSSPRTSLFR